MSVSSTSAAAQFEDAKKRVTALDLRQKDLEEMITLLEKYCHKSDSKLLAKLAEKEVYVKTAAAAKDKLAKLEEKLKSVNKQLESALEMQLVAARREEQRERQTQVPEAKRRRTGAFGAGGRTVSVKGKAYKRTEFCGKGSCCEVYRVEEPRDAVVKVYSEESRAQNEYAALRAIARIKVDGNEQPFPSVVAFEGQHLVVTPYARHFTRHSFTLVHAESLMKILRAVHASGRVHRDIRPVNFFQHPDPDKDGCVILNDWGCSVRMEDSVRYEGCSGVFRPPWRSNHNLYNAEAKDDLYSFVVACYCLYGAGELPEAWVDATRVSKSGSHTKVLAAVTRLLPPGELDTFP